MSTCVLLRQTNQRTNMQIYKLQAFISYLIGLVAIFVNIVYQITNIYWLVTVTFMTPAGIFAILKLEQALKEIK